MDTIYFYDRIIIYSTQTQTALKDQLPLNQLKKHSQSFEIKRVKGKGNYRGYRSMLDAVCPNDEFLRVLDYNEGALMPYFISYLEISKDIPVDTRQEALSMSRDFRSTARKKWARTHFIYTDFALEKPYDPKRFDIGTLYSRSKNFGIRAYSCISKPLDRPAFHREYVIKGPHTIRAKCSINSIQDLRTLDLKEWFRGQDERYLTLERVDKDRLGKWVLNWGRKKTFTKRERMRAGLAGAGYTRDRTPAEVVLYFRRLKRQVRKKSGPRTEWDKRVLRMDPTRFIDKLKG